METCLLTPHSDSHPLNLFLLSVTFTDITIMVHTIPYHANTTEKEMRGKKREMLPSSLPPWLQDPCPKLCLQPPWQAGDFVLLCHCSRCRKLPCPCPYPCSPSHLGRCHSPIRPPCVVWGAGAVSMLFCSYRCLSGANGIRDKQDKSLKVWMGCCPILC